MCYFFMIDSKYATKFLKSSDLGFDLVLKGSEAFWVTAKYYKVPFLKSFWLSNHAFQVHEPMKLIPNINEAEH